EEPFTISRHHCSIKRTGNGALIKDLESKTGIVVNGVRYGGRRAEETKVKVGPGVHSLILGSRKGKARFKLIIE
ncbi:MAG: FHA domain-containing protein, partial [Verrucomicrobiota bacterium]